MPSNYFALFGRALEISELERKLREQVRPRISAPHYLPDGESCQVLFHPTWLIHNLITEAAGPRLKALYAQYRDRLKCWYVVW